MRILVFGFLGLCFSFLLSLQDAHAARFFNCGGINGQKVKRAYSFIRNNLSVLKKFRVAKTKGRQRRIRRRMSRSIKVLRINCAGGVRCRNNVHGRATPLISRRIRICTRNISTTSSVCYFVNVLAHEFAHTVGIPTSNGHARGDRVHRFGEFAQKECISKLEG